MLGSITQHRNRHSSLGSWGTGETAEYNAEIADQYAKWKSGIKLSSLSQESIPSAMKESSSNVTGAYLKASWWLYVAARIAWTRGLPYSSIAATADAFDAKGVSGSASTLGSMLSWFNPIVGLVAGSSAPSQDPQQISTIFRQAAIVSASVPEVASILNSLGSSQSVATRQATVASSFWEQPVQNLPSLSTGGLVKSWKTVGIVVAVAVAVVVIGSSVWGYKHPDTVKRVAKTGAHLAKRGAEAAILL